MALQERTYEGATARDSAAEMFAEELAQALIAQAQSMGLRISVEVRGAALLAVLHDGGAFRVTIAPSAGDQ